MDQFELSDRDSSIATVQPLLETPRQLSACPSDPEIQGEETGGRIPLQIPGSSFVCRWGFEISALVLSFISFSALAYIFVASDGKPLSEWTMRHVTINTIISILAGVSKACLAFAINICLSQIKWNWYNKSSQPLVDFDRLDASSRGAWGSLRVLKSCIRRPNWAALGALATIALLAFEPFTQAILAFEDKQVILNSEEYAELAQKNNQSLSSAPTIGRSVRLNAGSWIGFRGGENSLQSVPIGPSNSTIYYSSDLGIYNIQNDMGLKAALWAGFSPLTSSQNLKPAFTCLSGNCSWTDFASVAVCHKCHDISQYIVKSTGVDILPGIAMPPATWLSGTPPDISNPWPAANANYAGQRLTHTKYKVTAMNFSLSNYDGKANCKSTNDNCPDTYLTSRMTTNPGQTLNFRHLNTLIMAIQYLRSNESWTEGRTLWEETKISSQECALFFCVNEYRDVLSQGSLHESVVASFVNRTPGSYESVDNEKNVDIFFKYTNYSLDMGNALVNLSDLQIRIPDEYFHTSNLSTQVFNITQTTIVSLLKNLKEGFWADDTIYQSTPLRVLIYPALGAEGPFGLIAGLGESAHIPSTIENVALSLTKWIRDRDLDHPVKGISTVNAIIISIRWHFFVFPIINFLAGIVFTVLCIWETQRSGRPAWKDSILATLSCAPDGDLRNTLREAGATDKLQDLSRKLMVTWHEDEGIGHLKEKSE
ncbi:hypothetical protein FPOAC2_12665 [Fusarium poae]|uniref:hypothetical protein n=1 Tax=Fusarium poae TaxID=36050 RepID=UPI001CE75721|nr:hypothetical protein FPOAC1_012332 [Fusarium poae]KAG8667500.1 hypothetical protein FPOAC1_012332 [Fusarium poae]